MHEFLNNPWFDDAQQTFDEVSPDGRDYCVMFAREVGCTVIGIYDPAIYDAAGVMLSGFERGRLNVLWRGMQA